jgi:hypothetical protein
VTGFMMFLNVEHNASAFVWGCALV